MMARNDEITNISWERVGVGFQEHEELRGRDHYGNIHVLDSSGPIGDPAHPAVGMGEHVYPGFENNAPYHGFRERYHLGHSAKDYQLVQKEVGGLCVEYPNTEGA